MTYSQRETDLTTAVRCCPHLCCPVLTTPYSIFQQQNTRRNSEITRSFSSATL